MPQLGSTDVSISIFIKHLERLPNLLLAIRITHLPRHHREEFREIDSPVSICVDLYRKKKEAHQLGNGCLLLRERDGENGHLADHVLKLSFGRVLAQRPHYGTKFLARDRSVTIYT